MKLSKEEMIRKYTERIEDNDDLKMELLEDISDSVDTNPIESAELEKARTDLEEMSWKYEDLKQKYIRRFSEGSEDPEDSEDEEKEEKEIIDIKEI